MLLGKVDSFNSYKNIVASKCVNICTGFIRTLMMKNNNTFDKCSFRCCKTKTHQGQILKIFHIDDSLKADEYFRIQILEIAKK